LVKSIEKLSDELVSTEKGIIIAGPMEYDRDVVSRIKKLSTLLGYPIFADGLSQLRSAISKNDKSAITNFNSILKSERFLEEHNPDIIIQFGRTPTSSIIESFLEGTSAARYLINSYSDKFDPTRNARAILGFEPKIFCDRLITDLKAKKITRHKSDWMKDFINAEELSEKIKLKILGRAKFPNELSIINEIMKFVPAGSNIFIGNSSPVRDFDNFGIINSKKLAVYFNRGASGIDGITSTALGIAASKKPTVLITGDLSFLHDLNALASAVKYSIPICIIIINNNGGGIFESLPIAEKVKKFREYFITPHNLELEGIIKSFGINYQLIQNRSKLMRHLNHSLNKKITSVFEVQTNAAASVELRNKYFNEVRNKLNKEFPL
jgi:2-succinyl-5-enolpyruvyl-6-hydroxy-3-cyclohexene-1-carboxylate synthase